SRDRILRILCTVPEPCLLCFRNGSCRGYSQGFHIFQILREIQAGMKKLLIIPFALFLTAVWAPAIQMHFKIYREFEDSDKRILASPPEWRSADISKF